MTSGALPGALIWLRPLSFGLLRWAACMGTTGSDREDVRLCGPQTGLRNKHYGSKSV